MRRRSIWRTGLVVVAAAALVTSCAKEPEEEIVRSGSGSAFDEGDSMSGEAVEDETTRSLAAKLKSVYFDYDRATLRDDARTELKANARALQSFPDWAKVTVEGHCDERGSEEYNLALGDRRATSVKKYLVALGVSSSKINTVSYGELKPAVRGHDETAWRWNRRAEFKVTR